MMTNARAFNSAFIIQHSAFLLILIAAFSIELSLSTRHNHFAFGYHPDEPTKTEQILSPDGFRNFLHPQLLLECTQRLVDWTGVPRDTQSVAHAGRDVSAFFAAVAVAAGCALGYLYAGLWGEILIGISLLCCSSLLVYAHYFKEDAGLAMGLLLVLLATRYFFTAKNIWLGAALVGAACAVAASAKYVGLVFLIPGLIAILTRPAKNWPLRLAQVGIALASFLLIAAAINYRGLLHFSNFRHSFDDEVEHSITGHFGLTMHRPNLFFIRIFPAEVTWGILAPAILAWPILILTWRQRTAWDLVALLIGPAFLALLSFSVIPFHRYVLPVVLMAHITAALAAIWILQSLRPPSRAIVTTIFAAIVLIIGVPRCASALHQFADDSRDRFRAWAIANLSRGTGIATDFYAGLLTQENFHQLPVIKTIGNGIVVTVVRSGPELGSIPLLRLQGYSYIAVTDTAYDRFFLPEVIAAPNSLDWFQSGVQWHRDLFAKYPLVWQSKPDLNLHAYTNPEIRVYEIDGLAKTPSIRQ
jgi:4-amino-4-deoxy-L-arabinose transferase-like glycosyltransferase